VSIFSFVSVLFLFSPWLVPGFDPKVAELTGRQYFQYLELCSTAENSLSYRTQIIYDLCEDPQIKVISDLPGSIGENTEINDYLNSLNKIQKNSSFAMSYDENVNVSQCKSGSHYIWTCQAKKTILVKGKSNTYNEVLEIGVINGSYKILSIHSDILRELSISCSQVFVSTDEGCKLVELAEAELKDNQIELAVAHLEESKSCGISYDPKMQEIINKVNLDSIYLRSYNKGLALMIEGDFNGALTFFNSIKRSYFSITVEFLTNVNTQIDLCYKEIRYQSDIAQGDFNYNHLNYKKSLDYFNSALLFKSTPSLQAKISDCENKIKSDDQKTMLAALSRIEDLMHTGKLKDQAEAFRIIMKYRYSGNIKPEHYFYAAQVAESPPLTIKTEFNLHGKDQCLLYRQMLLNAHNNGYETAGFNIYWDEYLTQKNRTCD
jgi:hypothetical protein